MKTIKHRYSNISPNTLYIHNIQDGLAIVLKKLYAINIQNGIKCILLKFFYLEKF